MANQLHQNAITVFAGKDRFSQNELMIWGQLPLSIKLSAKDTGGNLLLFEHRDMGKGGPPRHVHFEQDEWFYVVKGEFEFEVGKVTHRLRDGETLFAPRNIEHAWAHIGEEPGTLLTMVTPAGTFEDFILETTRYPNLPSSKEMEKAFHDHGMKLLGPALI